MPEVANEVLYVMMMTFLFTLITLYVLMTLARRSRASTKQPPRIITVIRCSDGSLKTRDFAEGDFVGKLVREPCEGEIIASYRE